MEHALDRRTVLHQVIEQLGGRHDGKQFALAQIAPFLALAQVIDDDQPGPAPRLQAGDQIGSDEAAPPVMTIMAPKYP